jgi:hypothetical protein
MIYFLHKFDVKYKFKRKFAFIFNILKKWELAALRVDGKKTFVPSTNLT